MIPVVLIAGKGSTYWTNWAKHITTDLLGNKTISPEDESLYFIADKPKDAVEHILQFYKIYHSSRYVRNDYVIRLNYRISESGIEKLNESFFDIIREGKIYQSDPLSCEQDHLHLPRLIVPHTRRSFGRIRQLIDMVNTCEPA